MLSPINVLKLWALNLSIVVPSVSTDELELAPAEHLSQLLRHSAAKGDLSRVRWLVSLRADVNAKSEYGLSALTKAARSPQNMGSVKWLVEHRADINSEGLDTPLSAAARAPGNLEMVTWLVSKGAKVQGNRWITPLAAAASKGNFETMEWLLQHGADINQAFDSHFQDAPLTLAAKDGDLGTVEWLAAHGADLNLASSDGYTALLAAAGTGGNLAVVAWLVSHGARIDQKDGWGKSAVSYAACATHYRRKGGVLMESGDLEMVKWFFDRSVPVSMEDVALTRNATIREFLLAHAAKPQAGPSASPALSGPTAADLGSYAFSLILLALILERVWYFVRHTRCSSYEPGLVREVNAASLG